MNRTHLWQLGAIAAATGLLCVAQAQTDSTSQAATESAMADAYTVPAKWTEADPSEADVLAVIQEDTVDATTAPATTEAAADTAATTAPLSPRSSQDQPTNVPMTVPSAAAMAAIVAPATAVEPAITREEVIAEAIYANQNGLIPRGEMSMVNEDKGMHWVEQAEQVRLARAEHIRVARLEARQQLAQR